MKTQHQIRVLLTLSFLALFSLNAQAAPVDISSRSCNGTVGQECAFNWDLGPPGTPGHGQDTSLFPILSGLDLLYKADSFDSDPLQSEPASEDGVYRDSYSTVFGGEDADDGYSTAHISYDGAPASPITECLTGECYLIVKGGLGTNPVAYLFTLALLGWDGDVNNDSPLNLSGFWLSGRNAISHVGIYGTVSAVPVPGAFWLFGTALIGFIGLSRSTRV
jgi:hypothetical protein